MPRKILHATLSRFSSVLRGRVLLVTTAAFVAAASLSSAKTAIDIQPTRLEIGAQNHFASFTLRNAADEPLVFQIETYAWAQRGNADALTPTHDLIVAPPILSLEGGASRIVRVALRDVEPGDREKTYRLLVTQVPPKSMIATGIRFVYQLSVPLFVAPSGGAGAKASWSARLEGNKHRIAVTVANLGNVHFRIDELRLLGGFGGQMLLGSLQVAGDVLAGATRVYEVPIQRAPEAPAITVEASAIGQTPVRTAVVLTP
jgi:fimbrial chaperone protein